MPERRFTARDISQLCGWRDLPQRHVIAAQLGPRLSMAAPWLMGTGQDIFLYRAWKNILGTYPPYAAQTIGDCTSHGSGHALDLLQCIEISLGHQAEEYKEICTECIYGMGREIGDMLGRGDGCFGSAVGKALLQGVVPREVVGPYDGKRAKKWGLSGVPAEIKEQAKEHKVKTLAMVKSTDELDAALANGYPGFVCSDQGFTMTRDANGVCKAEGIWQHCMGLLARRTRDGNQEYLIGQNWGDDVPDGPTTDDQPTFSFWIIRKTMERMLGQGDSFVVSGFDGFPAQSVPSSWTYQGFA